MDTWAAVITGKGSSAIASVLLSGHSAFAVLHNLFQSGAYPSDTWPVGDIRLGVLQDGTQLLDQVTVGKEGPDQFVIHCHGNPLIVERLMELLQEQGAVPLAADRLRIKILRAQGLDTLAIEASLALTQTRTLEGARLIHYQVDHGLVPLLRQWQENLDRLCLEVLTTTCRSLQEAGSIARKIIHGCKVAIAGPPNTGKSSLLNCLAGCPKAIVADVSGTTRDWVEATALAGPLHLDLTDTAGLDTSLLPHDPATIDQVSQARSLDVIDRSDLVLLVLDQNRSRDQLTNLPWERLADKPVITVLNKSDLPATLRPLDLPPRLHNAVTLCALNGTGIDHLYQAIQQAVGVSGFSPKRPLAFTERQQALLVQLATVTSRTQARELLEKLLHGPIEGEME